MLSRETAYGSFWVSDLLTASQTVSFTKLGFNPALKGYNESKDEILG